MISIRISWIGLCACILVLPTASWAQGWTQWGQNSKHTGYSGTAGQSADQILASIAIDPWAASKIDDNGGELLTHYPSPVIDGNDVFLMLEGGTYTACNSGATPCGAGAWNTLTWSVRRFSWSGAGDSLDPQWTFTTDWVPEPGISWEPVFHPVVMGSYVYAPGAAGSIWQINRVDGTAAAQIFPSQTIDPNTYVSGPLTTDERGNIYYNAVELDPTNPWTADVTNSWLVKVGTDGTVTTASYSSLTPGAPAGTDQCYGTFSYSQLPWPPSPTAVPPAFPCGSQRPGINITPAVAPDGTIYTISRAHLNSRYAYLVAVNPDLSPKWTASFRGLLNDGCGVTIPYSNDGGCRAGATAGVDYATNDLPAAQVIDQSSSTPVVAPDGSILYGAYTDYNNSRGHLMHFDRTGVFLNAYDFGWDTTPAIFVHDGAYSVIEKDNYYPNGPYYITQLNSDLQIEWQFQNTNTQSCIRNPDGTIGCLPADADSNGFEWCINAPAVDVNGTVYVNSEDGKLYVLGQGGVLLQQLFLNWALGSAYTPLALGPDGTIYTQNAGIVFVVGESLTGAISSFSEDTDARTLRRRAAARAKRWTRLRDR
ncbi:MAG TPA: hypothetical protein VGL53_21710 [Bryobacteraceae bacterium]|jgi:hypothetical protein